MRVLLISHTCQSKTEGQPKVVELARMSGIDLCLLVPDRWKHYGQWRAAEGPLGEGYRHEIGRVAWPWVGPAQFYLHWYPHLGRLLTEFRPDVIDLWEEPWGMVSYHTCRLRRKLLPSAKIISETEQNIDKKLPPPFEWFRSYTLRRADYAVGRNSASIEIIRRKGYRGPAEVVPNAVDEQLFRPMDRAQCRKDLGPLPDGSWVVGYFGRLVEEKGLSDLVEAIARCPAHVRLVLVGAGPMREPLLQQAHNLGLGDRLTILDQRPLSELPRLMNAIDLLALPSRTTARWKEQFGRVIIEAHSCATPVIGSDSGAIPDVIGQAGRVVPECDPAALAAAITQMAANPAEAREMGRLGREAVEQNYTWRRVAERMAAIYQRVMGQSSDAQSARSTGLQEHANAAP